MWWFVYDLSLSPPIIRLLDKWIDQYFCKLVYIDYFISLDNCFIFINLILPFIVFTRKYIFVVCEFNTSLPSISSSLLPCYDINYKCNDLQCGICKMLKCIPNTKHVKCVHYLSILYACDYFVMNFENFTMFL